MTESTQPACIDGTKFHDPDENGICKKCGLTLVKKGRAQVLREPSKSQRISGTTRKTEPSFKKSEIRDGIAMLLLASQTIIINARPDLREDALNPYERAMLADVLADEAAGSKQVMRFLAKVGQQNKHTKLVMVCMSIAMPRLARRGLLPKEGMDELQREFISQASTPIGSDGDTSTEQEGDWDTVPVESGGSPISNRGNRIGQNDIGGVSVETAPFRGGVENENGRREIQHGSDSEVVPIHVESTSEPDRTKTRSTTRRSKAG